MQQGYQNVKGWLGFIISDKIFIDFTKYQFDDAMFRLIHQIKLNNNNNNSEQSIDANFKSTDDTKLVQSLANSNLNDPKKWDEEECKSWFLNNQMNNMYEIMAPINGDNLYQLYEIKKSVPEFFFKSITSNQSVDYKAVAIFATNLIKIFEKN